jgi:MFS family permease
MADAPTRVQPSGLLQALPGCHIVLVLHLDHRHYTGWVPNFPLVFRWIHADSQLPGQPSFAAYMRLHQDNSGALTGTITGFYYVGGAIGSLFNSWFADRIDRK